MDEESTSFMGWSINLIKDKFAIRTKDKNGTVFIISDNLNKPILYNYHECKKYILKLKL